MISATTIATSLLLISLGSAAPGGGRSYAPEIVLETNGPHFVVYTEHRGPYWSLGKAFSSMRQHMVSKAVPGPLFAQYLDDPGSAPLDDLRTRIGFFVVGDVHAKVRSFYSSGFWPEQQVAILRVSEPRALLSRYGPALHRWAAENTMRASGPLVEVYGCSDRPAEVVCTELWLPVAPAEREDVREAAERYQRAQEQTERLNELPSETERAAGGVDRWDQRPDERWIESRIEQRRGGESGDVPVMAESPQPMPRALETEATAMPPQAVPNEVPERNPVAEPTRRNLVPDRARAVTSPVSIEPSGVVQADQGQVVVVVEIELACGSVVGELFARPGTLSDADRSWLAAVILRVRAAAKGVSRMYPGEDEQFTALHEELASRFEAAYGASAKEWVRRDQAREWGRSEERRSLLQQMDRILGKVAYRVDGPDMLLNEVCGVLAGAAKELSGNGR